MQKFEETKKIQLLYPPGNDHIYISYIYIYIPSSWAVGSHCSVGHVISQVMVPLLGNFAKDSCLPSGKLT